MIANGLLAEHGIHLKKILEMNIVEKHGERCKGFTSIAN